jgi:hypothetical protein
VPDATRQQLQWTPVPADLPSMVPSTAEPISPELALVCPELADRARRSQPARPWQLAAVTVDAAGEPAPAAATPLRQWAAAALYVVLAAAARAGVATAIAVLTVLVLTLAADY